MSDDRRYWPRRIPEEIDDDTSLLNEPVREDVRELRPGQRVRALHAVLCEALINTQALLTRLELGVQAPPGQARVTVRELYVQTRRQLKALSACLELDGLE